MNETGPQTLIEAVRYFTDKKICAEYMVKIKWPDGVIRCPKCKARGDRTRFFALAETSSTAL